MVPVSHRLVPWCLILFVVLDSAALRSEVVRLTSEFAARLAVSEGYVYFVSGHNIRRLDRDTGLTELARGTSYDIRDILWHDGYLYYSNGNYGQGVVCRISELTLSQTCFYSGNQPWRLARDTDYLYWGESNGGPTPNKLMRRSFQDGSITTVTDAGRALIAIAATGGWVYFANAPYNSPTRISVIPSGGGTTGTLYWTTNLPSDMRILGGRLYWTEYAGGVVNSVKLDDGTSFATIANGLTNPSEMDSDGVSLFVVESGIGASDGRVIALSIAGEVHVLGHNLTSPRDVAVQGDSVFWSDSGGIKQYCPGLCSQTANSAEPVLLIHGLASNNLSWSDFASILVGMGRQHGGYPQYDRITNTVADVSPGNLYVMNFSDAFEPMPSQSLTLAEQGQEVGRIVEEILETNPGAHSVTLIGHSMGGLAARSYLQGLATGGVTYQGGVSQLVTVGTPHRGAFLAAICADPVVGEICTALHIDGDSLAIAELQPGSDALAALNDILTNPLPLGVSYAAVIGLGTETLSDPGFQDGDGVVPQNSQDPGLLVRPWEIVEWAVADREDCGFLGLEVHTCETSDLYIMDQLLRRLSDVAFADRFEAGDLSGWMTP